MQNEKDRWNGGFFVGRVFDSKQIVLPGTGWLFPGKIFSGAHGFSRKTPVFAPVQKGFNKLFAHAALTLVGLLYGMNYFTAKLALAEVHPFAAVAMRCLVATTVFLIFHAVAIKEKIRDKKDYLLLFFSAVFGISANQLMFLLGLSKTEPINAGVLMITTPVFVFLLSFLTKRENIRWYQLIGLGISFVGAFWLIQMNKGAAFSLSNETLQGDLLIMANAASYGIYLVMVKPLILKYNTFTIVKWIFLFGTVINVAVGMPWLVEVDFGSLSGNAWLGLGVLIVGATLMAYFLNAWAMKQVQPSAVGVYIFIQPVFVTIVTILFYEGVVTAAKLGCILLIVFGVFMVTIFKPGLFKKKDTPENS